MDVQMEVNGDKYDSIPLQGRHNLFALMLMQGFQITSFTLKRFEMSQMYKQVKTTYHCDCADDSHP